MAISQIIEQISTDPQPLYLVSGRSDYWESQILTRLQQLVPAEERTMNFATYDLEETSLGDALNDAQSVPFFGDRRVVVIQNATFLTGMKGKASDKQELEDLITYLQNPSPATVLVVFAPYEKLDNRKRVTKQLKKSATILDLNAISERETTEFVRHFIQKQDYQIEPDAVVELFARTQGDLALIMNELRKLFLFCREQHVITADAVDQLVAKSTTQNVFDLSDKLLAGKTNAAIEFYHELLTQREDPIKINALLESQFRLLLQVKILQQHGQTQAHMAQTLKVHPYRIKIASRMITRFSIPYLEQAFAALVEIEHKLKSSTANPELLFEMFAIQFSQKNT
ncbi:DNA polymerase III subunit delta [Fructilactobacillus carniphilus]|uniref:DNA polymerase III subunit delta n=1 Tax=Fructilactobacillus carniphilus TaxID=2940297 RepID=A0ABY5C0V1_9LACO|nr:DNA polymerase III subunit delta [Fructilactobacillus carniphilus]USS90931.1 DNA polymerase III subunit delta [Fructilactobacillus carniphilus]